MLDGQRLRQARAVLASMDVSDVGTDRVRAVGRAGRADGVHTVSELCGHCGRGRAAVSPDGEVWPCVLSRWMRTGNVREQSLAEILCGPVWREMVAAIPSATAICGPDKTGCRPKDNGGDCQPADKPACKPKFS